MHFHSSDLILFSISVFWLQCYYGHENYFGIALNSWVSDVALPGLMRVTWSCNFLYIIHCLFYLQCLVSSKFGMQSWHINWPSKWPNTFLKHFKCLWCKGLCIFPLKHHSCCSKLWHCWNRKEVSSNVPTYHLAFHWSANHTESCCLLRKLTVQSKGAAQLAREI